MRRSALVFGLLVFAVAAFADDTPPAPDYSQKALLHILAPPLNSPRPPGRVQWHFGYVDFRALKMDWRIAYLPFRAPLPGARLNDGATIPNPFALTGTPYASTLPPMFDNDRSREVQREYRRIERLTKKQLRP